MATRRTKDGHSWMPCNIPITKTYTEYKDKSLRSYFREVARLSREGYKENPELLRKALEGDEKAVQDLVKSHLRFVVSIAKQYQNKGVPLIDLIQEGNLGLMNSIRHFKPDKGVKFITYAVWWIRQSIMKAVSHTRKTVRLPVSQFLNMGRIRNAVDRYVQRNDVEPSYEAISKMTGIPENKVRFTINGMSKTVSLDAKPYDDSKPVSETVEDDTPLISETMDNDKLSGVLDGILDNIPYRERDIVRLTYGLGVPQMTNKEIAALFGIGEERVRQILHGAVKIIRRRYGKKLRDWL